MPTQADVGPAPIRRAAGRPSLTRAASAALASLLAAGLAVCPTAVLAGAREAAARPGAYCPLPEKGQKPVCLAPAQAKYGEFFAALEKGQVNAASAAAIESDLTGGGTGDDAYLALSSLSYGYWRLAEAVGSAPDADPALLARLDHWNDLLLELYGETRDDPPFQAAVRAAAVDLHRNADLGERCPHSYPGGCDHTADLVRAIAAVDDRASVRSPLSQLLERLVGGDGGAGAVTRPVSDSR